MNFRSFAVCAVFGLSVAGLSGRSFNSYIYRPDVHQGNLVTEEMIQQLQVGMSRQQVLFLLGEPLVQSQFHTHRWDYTYYFNPRYGDIESRKVTLTFDDQDRLTAVAHDALPTEKQADEMILGQETDFKITPLVVPERDEDE